MFRLIENEVVKVISKKRLLLVFGIAAILITLFAYGETQVVKKNIERNAQRIGSDKVAKYDWKKLTKLQIQELKSRLDNQYIDENRKKSIQIRVDQLEYNVKNNINPLELSSAKFTSKFMEIAITLFLPLLIIIIASDMVSSETSAGTIKLLLVRSKKRWKILLSKFIALVLMEIIIMVFIFLLSALISSLFFGFKGWYEPVATGFKNIDGKLVTDSVISIPQIQYIILVYSLGFFVALIVGAISFMISVLVKSTASSTGVMMALIISGNFLSFLVPDWDLARYFFMVNLNLPSYLSGSYQPISGVNMMFSVLNLTVWGIVSLIISFVYFQRKDIY